MAYICTSPHVYQGDPGDAPEFRTDDAYTCIRCREEFDNEDDGFHKVNGEKVCRACVPTCDLCGLWMDDSDFPEKVIEIRFREWQNNGKLSDPHCPQCAGDWLLGLFLGVQCCEVEQLSRGDIALLLAVQGVKQ